MNAANMKKVNPIEIDGKIIDIKGLGKSLRLTHNKTMNLSRVRCEHFLEMPEFLGERPLSKMHAVKLSQAMLRGTFLWERADVTECFCKEPHDGNPAGTTYRMNGQHTCTARLNIEQNGFVATTRHIKYEADTVADMKMLYASIDRGTPRTKRNVTRAYLCDHAEFEGIPQNVVRDLPTALMFWLYDSGHDRKKFDADSVAYLVMTKYTKRLRKIGLFLASFASAERRYIKKASVMAAMIETFQKSATASDDFWRAVMTGAEITGSTDPRGKLKEFLTMVKIGSGTSRQGDLIVQSESIYRICIGAWNLWRKGTNVTVLRATQTRKRAK